MTKNKIFTVITGATRGLGKAYSYECAKRGRNLILIALPDEQIFDLADDLMVHFHVEVITFEGDLTNTDFIRQTITKIKEYQVDMLINNAGVGGTMKFIEATDKYIDTIILLNMRALVLLTRGLIPVLQKNRQAYILNVASMASFGPMPYKTVYPASKAFVYSFSRGLYAEMKGTNVFVSVVHPGGMATNEDVTKRINAHGKIIRSTILSPERIASISISRLLRKDSLIIPGFMNKISWIFLNYVPVWIKLIVFRLSMRKELRAKTYGYA
jgi:uncharacterized protein